MDYVPYTIPRVGSPGPPLAVEVYDLFRGFGRDKPVLDGVNLTVRQGSIFGLLGPSGCGKTTLLSCLVGRIKPEKGTIRVFGQVPGTSKSIVPGKGVGYMPQELALFTEISIKETLFYFGRLFNMNSKQITSQIDFLVKFLHLPPPGIVIGNLSGGQQRRVSLAASLIHMPPLLILDEPTVGVDPLLRQTIWEYLVTLADEKNMTIIITTHYIEEANLAHTVGMMRNGHILAQANPKYLMSHYGAPTLEAVFLKLCLEYHNDSTEDKDVDEPNKILVPTLMNDPSGIKKRRQNSVITPPSEFSPLLRALRPNRKAAFHSECSKLSALVTKNFVRIRRNLRLLLWQFLMPAIQITLFSLCMGGDPFGLKIAVVNEDVNSDYRLGENFLTYLDKRTIYQVPYISLDSAIQSVKDSQTWGVVHLGSNFSDCFVNRFSDQAGDEELINNSTIKLYMDLTNQQISYALMKTFDQAFHSFLTQLLNKTGQNTKLATLPIEMGPPVYGEINPSFMEFMAAGFIISIAFGMPMGLTAIIFIIEKKEGLINRTWVAGAKAWQVMAAHLVVQFFVMICQMTIVLAISFFIFKVPVRGPFYLVVIIVLMMGTCGMAFGLILSAVNNDEMSAVMMAIGSFYTNLLLSGTLWPIESMSWLLRIFCKITPQTLPLVSLRSVMSRGLGISAYQVWPGLIVSLSWTLAFLLATQFIFRAKL